MLRLFRLAIIAFLFISNVGIYAVDTKVLSERIISAGRYSNLSEIESICASLRGIGSQNLKSIACIIAGNIKQIDPKIVATIITESNDAADIIIEAIIISSADDYFVDYGISDMVNVVIQEINGFETTLKNKILGPMVSFDTQSRGCMQRTKVCSLLLYSKKFKAVRPAWEQSLSKEKEVRKKNGYILYHGINKGLEFLTDVYTRLWEIKNKRKLNNYRFLRFLDLNGELLDFTCNTFPKKTADQLLRGRGVEEIENSLNLLFTNPSLCFNLGRNGECTMDFLYNGHNFVYPGISVKHLFGALDMDNIYSKYQAELEKIQTFGESIGRGRLIQLEFTREQLLGTVYAAEPCGYGKDIYVEGKGLLDRNKDVDKVLDILTTEPNSIKEYFDWLYCVVLTPDRVLNPDYGVKMHVYHTGNDADWKKYQSDMNSLFTKIKNDYVRSKSIWGLVTKIMG